MKLKKNIIKLKSVCHSSSLRGMRSLPGQLWSMCLPSAGETGSEQKGSHAAHLALLLDEDLKVLVDDGDCKQDPSSRPDGTQEVSQDREGPYAQPAKGRGCGNVPEELAVVSLGLG
jgi:hypothetical protein